MTLRLALRSLAAQPVRSIVLAVGFGSGIAAMAGLLGIGEVILEQARSPALRGGGDLVIWGAGGEVKSARFLLQSILAAPPLAGRTKVASPSIGSRLYLVREDDEPLAVRARGGIPSLERAIGDPETTEIAAWTDAAADEAWSSPDPGELLRSMDRFHPIPDATRWKGSWAEWLYFNGRAGEASFYLTFLVGPEVSPGKRQAGVRLQLERDGRRTSYGEQAIVPEAELLAQAPDLRIGENSVQLDGLRYKISLALDAEGGSRHDLTGELTLDVVPGRSIPPFEIRGANGWLSGYVVPVLTGSLGGTLDELGETVSLDGGEGYHDHNWGFWEGVTWQWGQVAHDDISFVYGRIRPPAGAADPERVPGLLVALGNEGPLGFTTRVTIEETEDEELGHPREIVVRGEGRSLSIEMQLTIEEAIRTRLGPTSWGESTEFDFFQLSALYRVSGRVGEREVEFSAPGAAETFRGSDRLGGRRQSSSQ